MAQVKERNESGITIFKELLASEGWRGLYTGIQHMLIVLGCSNFVYFYVSAALKAMYLGKVNRLRAASRKPALRFHDINNAVNLVIATLAGVVNVLSTTPLWVVATRLAVQRKYSQAQRVPPRSEVRKPVNGVSGSLSTQDEAEEKRQSQVKKPTNILQGLVSIMKTEGLGALWSGTTASLILVSNPAIQFSAYAKLKAMAITRLNKPRLSSVEYLIIGALSKMVATILTYPLQLSQTKLRSTATRKGTKKLPSTIVCLQEIYQSEGVMGWFKGMDAKLTQTCLTAAFMFAFYEKINFTLVSLLTAPEHRR